MNMYIFLTGIVGLLGFAAPGSASEVHTAESTRFAPVRCEIEGKSDNSIRAYVEQTAAADTEKMKILFIAGDQTILWMKFSVWQHGKKISPEVEHRLTIGGRIAFMIEMDRPEQMKKWAIPSDEPWIRVQLHGK